LLREEITLEVSGLSGEASKGLSVKWTGSEADGKMITRKGVKVREKNQTEKASLLNG
jgi:hypothetical protein